MEIKYNDGKTFEEVWREAAWKHRNVKSYLMARTNPNTTTGNVQRVLIEITLRTTEFLMIAGFVYSIIKIFG